MAILHGEERLARLGHVSDVDVVSDIAAFQAVQAAAPYWLEIGLHPIIFWPYDVGGTATVFLATPGAEQGVQLDILYDPDGQGRYGLRSTALLEYVVPGTKFPRLHPSATQTYTARKRQVKGDLDAYRASLSAARPEIERVAQRVLAPRAARELIAHGRIGPRRMSSSRVRRLAVRVAKPVGAWVHLIHNDAGDLHRTATALTERLERILPHITMSELPSRGPWFAWWWGREVAPIRWRPGVFISWSNRPSKGPDVRIEQPADVEDAAQQMVAALRNRALR